MTLLHKNVGQPFLVTESGEDARPQLISRHSSSLPVTHNRGDAKKKALSRRSRSASPCVKKTHSTYSGNAITVLPQQKRKIAKDVVDHSMQLPLIKKQVSQPSGKNFKPARSSISNSKQRGQVLSEHKRNLKVPSVWENICGAVPRDVNSNFNYDLDSRCGYNKPAYYELNQNFPLSELEDGAFFTQKSKSQSVGSSPFDKLPFDCKLNIFSYLSHMDLGRCMLVSREWRDLVKTPELWKTVNLREFVLCYGHDTQSGSLNRSSDADTCTSVCYNQYMSRIDRFISFLIDVQPLIKVRRIAISFDLATDRWLERLKRLFRHVNFSQLRYADIDWHTTPVKPLWLVAGHHSFQLNDVTYATRRRERLFLEFLEEFSSDMPNLESLIVPFSWTERAMRYLTWLPSLRALVLKKYTVFCAPHQAVFDELANMKCLEKLLLEVWMSTTNPPCWYSISSASLKYLDLSQCRGFYLQNVDLPSLEVLKIDRNSAVCQNQANLPCLYDLLRHGAPKLKRINNSVLALMSAADLERLLSCVCPCKRHHLT